MQVYGADLTKEHYKLLKFCHGKHHVSFQDMIKKFGLNMIRHNLPYLRTQSFLLQDYHDDNDKIRHYFDNVYITSLGENAYSLMKEARNNFWKELFLSKWIDIIVAFITAGITADHWQSIKTFVVNLVSALFK